MKSLSLLTLLLMTTFSLSAQLAVTIPGEFEKKNGLILAWSQQDEDNLVIADFIRKAEQGVDTIWLLYQQEPSMDTTSIQQFLTEHGASIDQVRFIASNYETPLIGNYGPIIGFAAFDANLERFIYNGEYTAYGTPHDDSVSIHLAQEWDWPFADIPLELDGSNILHDGIKYGFSTTQLLDRNPSFTEAEIKNILRDKYNIDNWIFLNPLTQSGGGTNRSIDKFMQFIDFETILVSSYPDTMPDFTTLEQNITTLELLTTAFGEPYRIIRIPASPGVDGNFGVYPADELRSYTNSVILNNLVFVPSYGIHWYDSIAKSIYQEAMPGYQVHLVEATYLSSRDYGLGNMAAHYPQDHYLRIEHSKLLGPQPYQPDMQITCLSKAGELVEEMWLYYKINSDTVFEKTPVYLVCPEHFGKIEGLLPNDTVHYYLEAISSTTTTTYPLSAPEGQFTFWFEVVSEVAKVDQQINSTTFPNPNFGTFSIRLLNGAHQANLQIYDFNGRMVLNEQIVNNQKLDLNSVVEPGIYFARIQTNEKEEVIKIVIQ